MSNQDVDTIILALAVGTLLVLPAIISEMVAKKLGPVGDVLKLLDIL
ncbi:hypothetical protein ES703_49969 [subsurface metagenome]